jgi:hypothetical protein
MKSFATNFKNINMKNIKNLINENTKTKVIGVLTILVILWLILYFIPELFTSLFNTILGNLILLTICALSFMYNLKYGFVITILTVILYRVFQLSRKEGFAWNPQSTQDFILIQSTINPQKVFDVNLIQKNQVSQSELDYFNKHKMWPWSQKTIELYVESLTKNPFIRTWPEDGVNYARSIYNEAAILRVLSYQTKEGQFLLNGVLVQDPSGNRMEDLPNGFGDFPYKSGLLGNKSDDVIKCNMNNPNGAALERTTYTGKGGIYGEQTSKVTPVDYNDLENIIPGFTFLNAPCNPCGAINETPDYSCPFKLTVKNKPPFISKIWQYLWNIDDSPLHSMPSFLQEDINPNQFPLLSELQTELKKQNTYTPPEVDTK